MSAFRTTNPLLNDRTFSPDRAWQLSSQSAEDRSTFMTLEGTVNKSLLLVSVCTIFGILAWQLLQARTELLYIATFGACLVAFALVLVASFKPKASPYVALPIAACEGIFAGGVSVIWSAYAATKAGANPDGLVGSLGTGLVFQAMMLTLGITGGLLLAYKSRLIKATENFKLGVVAATAGICFVSLGSILLSLFGIQVPYIWGNGIIGIGFAGVVVVVAALNLVLDFDFIEKGAEQRLPKHMEWLAGIGLLVTLVWLYVSILRLLAMLQSRD